MRTKFKMLNSIHTGGGGGGSQEKKSALTGNRTRASRVAGENSTTEPSVLRCQCRSTNAPVSVLLCIIKNKFFAGVRDEKLTLSSNISNIQEKDYQ